MLEMISASQQLAIVLGFTTIFYALLYNSERSQRIDYEDDIIELIYDGILTEEQLEQSLNHKWVSEAIEHKQLWDNDDE